MKHEKGAVVVFVKTSGVSPVKTRLAETLGEHKAMEFHRLSCQAMGDIVAQTQLVPYWAVAESEALQHPDWSRFERIAQGPGGLGERLSNVYSQVLSKHPFVVFLGADSPQIKSSLIEEAAEAVTDRKQFAIGPAEDGGYYLFAGGVRVDPEIWTSVPYSRFDTAEVFTKRLSTIAPVRELATHFDVDNNDEFQRLSKVLGSVKNLLPAQQRLLDWMKKSGG